MAVVGFDKEIMIAARCLHMRHLKACRLNMVFMYGPYFFRARPCHYTAMAAIIADMIIDNGIAAFFSARPCHYTAMAAIIADMIIDKKKTTNHKTDNKNIADHCTVYVDNSCII